MLAKSENEQSINSQGFFASKLNFFQIKTLEELSDYGLTVEILLKHGDRFDHHHYGALLNLVKKRSFSIQQAFSEINSLSLYQLHGIRNGLDRKDLLNLTNIMHIVALTELKTHGLTEEMLLNHNKMDPWYTFDHNHCYALIKLVEVRELTIVEALAEIEGLSSLRAEDLEKELCKEEFSSIGVLWKK